jgi:hypothetical protein
MAPDQADWGSPQHDRRRRSGLRWKLALAALAVLGAAAGAATIMLLRHHAAAGTNGSPGSSSSSSQPGQPVPAGLTGASINTAIDEPIAAPPAGYQAYNLSSTTAGTTAGFRIGYPTGWAVRPVSTVRIQFTDPGLNAYLRVDLTPHTFTNMLAEAQYIEQQSLAKHYFPGYQRVGLARLNIRGTPGAYWKFTWNDNGVRQEALDLLYIANTSAGQQSYALYFTAPAGSWTAMHKYFNVEAATFAPVPS